MNREQRRSAAQEIKKLQKMEAAKFAVWLAGYQKAAYQDGFEDGLAAEGVTCLKQLQMKGEPDPLREWVPVETTLPPDEDRVLCCTMNKKGAKNLVIGYYMGGMWRVGMNSNVIAW